MTDKLAQIRAQLPAVHKAAFLNTGTCGPLPTPAAAAISALTQVEYEQGRASTKRFQQMMNDKIAVREGVARLLHVEPETIALTHHTTDGMNIATHGYNWQPGDEVVTTTIEHEAGLYPLYVAQTRWGIKINYADVGLGADPVAAIDAAITPKTRLLSISHVSYSTGARFPLAEIIEVAHSKGVPVLADGAQTAGAFDLDLAALDVDYYAIPGQKWLCGPEGIGALYVRPDRLEELHPTYVGYFSFEKQDWRGSYTLQPGAKRYEVAMMYPATVAAMRASLEWFHNVVEPEWAYNRIASLAAFTRNALEALSGVRVTTPAARQASLVNFIPVGWSPARMAGMVEAMAQRGYIIRNIPHEPFCVRVSCGFYNTEAELSGFVSELAKLLVAGPQSVEIPAWAEHYHLSDEAIY